MILPLRKSLYIIFLLIPFISLLRGQELQFHTLTEENVFDKQPVLSIVQDNKGRLWFAGGNDIYCYNSKSIINLRDQDSSWNKVGYITKLTINSNHQLLIASSTGIHIYNTEKQILTPLPLITKTEATTGKKESDNIAPLDILDIRTFEDQLYLATKKGLYCIDLLSLEIVPLIRNKAVYTFAPVGDRLYFATSNSIEYLRKSAAGAGTPIIRKILDLPPIATSEDLITTLLYEEENIWVGTKFHGLFHYTISGKQLSNYNESNSNLLSNYVRKVIKGPDGNIWVGTLKGLSIYKDTPTFQNYYHNSLNPHTLTQNSIYDIFVDRQRIAWIGTYFGGMNMAYPTSMNIHVHSTKHTSPFRLSSDIIGSITESENGYWIGTEEDGINFLDKTTGQIKTVRSYARSNLIKDVYLQGDKLYIAQFSGGYSIADTKTHTVQHFTLSKDTLDLTNNVFSIYVDTNQTIYLGTNLGLYIQNNLSEKPIRATSVPQTTINKIKQDDSGNLYLQQGNRLFVRKKHTNNFEYIQRLGSMNINDFFLEANQLWVTVADQVYRLTNFEKLDSIVHLKGNQLGSIAKLGDKLWLSSKQGLIYYDLSTQYMNILTKEDGLPSNNLGSAKIYIDTQQNILLTTQNGLVSFPALDMSFNKQPPQTFFTSIKVNDKMLPAQRIQKEEEQTITIHLKHNETFLSIDFASSNLIKPTKNRYRYQLKGFDKDWKEVSVPNIQYSNLPVGEHLLTVFASNNDGVWSEKPLLVTLIVHPPFYLTWWAFIIYAVLVLAVIHFIIKFIVEREILINSEKEHEKKIKFFTHISHEIRTPLTLITAPLDEIINETAGHSNTQQKILRIKKNTNKLLAVINELLDFNKFDDKQQKLRLQKIELSAYLEDSFYLLSDLAQLKELNYYIRRLDKCGLFWIDPQQFDKVMFNLLSNAIKYTPKGGTVFLDLAKTSQGVEICIVDSGIGVSEANQFKIFEEYYRQEATEDVLGTGIGLSLTKKIIEQHGGNIICETLIIDNKSWTRFKISLEQNIHIKADMHRTDDIDYKPEVEVYSAIQTDSINDKQEIILIIEDNKELLEIISSIFQETYQVLTAQDGQEGLDKAKHYLPSLIISDMMMPKINGLQLCQLLKQDLATSHIPFILLTAINDEDIHTETLKHGANIYLTKPFDKGKLYLSVRNLLAIAQKQRKDFQIKTSINNEIDQKFISTLDLLIEEHIMDDGFDVNYISRAMGMSAPILYRKLKAITDLSLNNYVKLYRLNKAKELLTSSQMNISEIAYAVGFSDRKYFSKEFKKHFGVNPSEYTG